MDETVTQCECPLAGVCHRHQTYKTAHYWRLCQTRIDYFELWESGGGPRMAMDAPEGTGMELPVHSGTPAKPRVVTPDAGPGTEMRLILKELGVAEASGCACASKAREMNKLGVRGCREQMPRLVAWMQEAAERLGWIDRLAIASQLIATKMFWQINPKSPTQSLIELAILRAEAKEHDCC